MAKLTAMRRVIVTRRPLCPARNLPRRAIHSAALILQPEKSLLNLRIDFMEPLFGAFGSILIISDVSFQPRDPNFCRSKLIGKLLSQIEGMSTIFFDHAGGLVKQVQNGLPGGI